MINMFTEAEIWAGIVFQKSLLVTALSNELRRELYAATKQMYTGVIVAQHGEYLSALSDSTVVKRNGSIAMARRLTNKWSASSWLSLSRSYCSGLQANCTEFLEAETPHQLRVSARHQP